MTFRQCTTALIAAIIMLPGLARSQQVDLGEYADYTPYQERWLKTEPRDPSRERLIAYGGRLYDNWMKLVDRAVPETRHPSYPAAGKTQGPQHLALQGMPWLGLELARRCLWQRIVEPLHRHQGDQGLCGRGSARGRQDHPRRYPSV